MSKDEFKENGKACNDPLQRRGARLVRRSHEPCEGEGGRAGWATRHTPYDPLLKERAKQLRKHMTLAEVLLWNQLKNKQMLGYDFDRQRPVTHYIVDFFCKKLNLAVEIDGRSHDFKSAQDAERQRQLEGMGVRFIRFWDYEVKHDMKSVLERMHEWILEEEKTHPGLPPAPRLRQAGRPPFQRRGPRKGGGKNNE